MPDSPEQAARENIDRLLTQAGWAVQDIKTTNIHAGLGVAIREFPLAIGHGCADYLLYVQGRAAGVIEAKKAGATLTGVEVQSAKYQCGLPDSLPAWFRPLPFCYQSTGIETHFTNGFDPNPRSRNIFAFHRPDTLASWLQTSPPVVGGSSRDGQEGYGRPATFRQLLKTLPPLIEGGLWAAQIRAIHSLEASLAADRPRALIQMATGSGKTFTAINFIYRLIKFAGARRVLFLVDRGNLGRQTKKEFDQYVSPYNNFKFGEEYIVQHLGSNHLDRTARVVIATIQRLYSMLKGRELSEEDEEASISGIENLFKEPEPITYNPTIPIETVDVIVTDECHRSIYNLWRQVLEYFDAHLIGLTATPSKQTFGFFNRNLVMEYNHEQAVADGVNVNYDVYRIRTQVTEEGGRVEAGYYVDLRDRETRKVRWEVLEEDFEYDPDQLDRRVVAMDQIRTIVRTFKEKLFTEIFPGRTEVPKTLFFAKDDSHAEDIVMVLREEFGKGNDFAQKITYRTTSASPEQLIRDFRTSYFPRIVVSVDMIATGTDIKPLEIVVFMRAVKSRTFFEQMKGRGVRVISEHDLQQVNPGPVRKDHFVIVDAVGVCEADRTDSRPMDQKKSVSFEKLLQAVALGNTEPEVLSSVAARLARLDKNLIEPDKARIAEATGGATLKDLASRIVAALNPDNFPSSAYLSDPAGDRPGPPSLSVEVTATTPSPLAGEPTTIPSPPAGEGQGEGAYALQARIAAVKPLYNPKLRNLLIELKKKSEQIIDTVTPDAVLEAGFSEAARERARRTVESFEQFIADHRDEITALQIIYSRPRRLPLRFEDLKTLAETLQAPPRLWTESQLWQAYAALDKSRVRGAGQRRILTDLVSLVRFAMHQENELVPFPERVAANFKAWLGQQEATGRSFTPEQRNWLEMIRDHIAANLGIDLDDFEYAPFAQEGGIGKVHQLFGDDLPKVLDELNTELAA